MRRFKRKEQTPVISRADALECRPVKWSQVTESRLDSGDVMLAYPQPVRPWLRKLANRLGGDSERVYMKKLQLDQLGTEVWDCIDGKQTVRQIVSLFADRHRLPHKEAEVAVTQFLRDLGRRGIIGMH